MDIPTILTFVFGSTSLVGFVTSLIYRKQNKHLKDNEVKANDAEVVKAQVNMQREQMNLGEDYMKKVMELSEMNYQQSLKNGKDNADIIAKVDRIYTEQKSIVEYLNGDYQDYLKRKGEAIITT
jgi:hypothetical protein